MESTNQVSAHYCWTTGVLFTVSQQFGQNGEIRAKKRRLPKSDFLEKLVYEPHDA
jgi:hypothetical protein